MKRTLIFAVLAAFLLGAMAYATETRVMTMGEVNNIVKDEANIWMYPSTINYYPKLFIGEFTTDYYDKDGSAYLWKVGANFPFGEESGNPWVLGAYFSEEAYYNDIVYYYSKSPEYAGKLMSLYYGRNLGEMPFGFVFSYFNDKDKNEDSLVSSNYEESLSRMEFSLGLSPLDKKLDIGVGIAFTTWTDEEFLVVDGDSAMRPITEPSGNMDFAITARYWMDPMGKYVLVPHAGLMYSKEGADFYGTDEDNKWAVWVTREDKCMELELGLGMNYEASENVLLVGDMGFSLENDKETADYVDPDATDYSDEYKWLALPYFKLGIDGEVFKWLNLRSGVWTRWTRYSDKWDAYDRSETYVSTSTYFGAGFHWNNLVLDAAINTDFLENGPYFISGENDYLTEQVTLKYMF